MLDIISVKNYVERYLNRIFDEKIEILVLKKFYIINHQIKTPICEFWSKSDEELLNDFDDYLSGGDYIGTIFFFLSGYWEYIHNDIKDVYGRFPSKESFQHKKDIIEKPVVDILIDRIIFNQRCCVFKN